MRAEAGGAVTGVVQIVPIRRAAYDIFGTDAIVVLSEPKQEGGDAALIQSLFDLTPAEIAVAQSIAAGLSVGQIAASERSVNCHDPQSAEKRDDEDRQHTTNGAGYTDASTGTPFRQLA